MGDECKERVGQTRQLVEHGLSSVICHNLWVATHKLCYVQCGSMCGVPGKHLYVSHLSSVFNPGAAHNCRAFLGARQFAGDDCFAWS